MNAERRKTMKPGEIRKMLGTPLEEPCVPSGVAQAVLEEHGGLLVLDLAERYGRRVDKARKPRQGSSSEIRKWWCGEFRKQFGASAISGGRAAGQFARLLEYLGKPEDAQRYLEFVLERWPEIKDRWAIVGNPDPGFLLGWKHRIVRAMQTGDIPRIAEAVPGEGEAEEWS